LKNLRGQFAFFLEIYWGKIENFGNL